MLHVVKHPLVAHHLGILRDRNTAGDLFRRSVGELSLLLAWEALRDLPQKEGEVMTPLAPARVQTLAGEILLVPVLRAGLGMMNGILPSLPRTRVALVGLYRDEETFTPVEYYQKWPVRMERPRVLVLDPMLATGGSLAVTLDLLKGRGVTDARVLCLVAAPEGVAHLERTHPGVEIFTAALDQGLNERQYIVPGLGDAGDRLMGTGDQD